MGATDLLQNLSGRGRQNFKGCAVKPVERVPVDAAQEISIPWPHGNAVNPAAMISENETRQALAHASVNIRYKRPQLFGRPLEGK